MQPRQRHTAILLPPTGGSLAGRVLVIGGASTGNSVYGGLARASDSVEIYNPVAVLMSFFGTMTTARQNHTATLLQDGRILIAGGVDSPSISGTAEYRYPVGSVAATKSEGAHPKRNASISNRVIVAKSALLGCGRTGLQGAADADPGQAEVALLEGDRA